MSKLAHSSDAETMDRLEYEAREKMDHEANIFAMELLMPGDLLRADIEKMRPDLESGRGVKELAKRYKVSEFLMATRLGSLMGEPNSSSKTRKG